METNELVKREIMAVQGNCRVTFRPGDELVMVIIADWAAYVALIDHVAALGLKLHLVRIKNLFGATRRLEVAVEVPDGWTPR